MSAIAIPNRSEAPGEYLGLLQSLSLEVERAMQAIACNDLEALESSIARQQEKSERLSMLADELGQPPAATHSILQPVDDDLRRQIHDSALRLQQLNLRYSLLLRHSSRSLAMMATLFRSFRGQFQEEDAGTGQKQQTWSCRL